MNTSETLALLKEALAKASDDLPLNKAWSQSASATSGLTAYDLEAPAKTLYPVLTPLRNALPRVSGKGGIQANWRAITGINTTSLSAGVSEGNRGGVITSSTADYLAAYKGLGLEDYVTFEADYAAAGFDDVRARAQQGLLRALMIQEERIILGGNTSLALGTTPTPSLTTATTGGTLVNQTWSVVCVALTMEGFLNSTVAGGIPTSATRTNADASTDAVNGGTAIKSASATQATTGTTSTISATVTAVRGACGYAWFWGLAGSEILGAVTSINSVLISAAATGTQTLAAVTALTSDKSRNTLIFDGFLTFAFTSGNNGYYKAMATGTAGTGTALTSGTDGTISEWDTALQYFWDTYKLSPSTIWVSSQEMGTIRKKILGGSTTAAQRFTFNVQQNGLIGGTVVKGYTNPFTMSPNGEEIPVKLHPHLPAGTILFTTDSLPYPLSNVTNVAQIRTRQEYYSLEWPRKSRKYEYGVYCDEVLQVYAPFAFGVITNIAAG